MYFSREESRKKIKHGEQQQSHFYVSTYINAMDFFFPFLILYWAAKVREPLANLAVYERGLSFVVDPREAKAKRSSDVDDVFTGRRERQSRCCLVVYTKSGGQNWRTLWKKENRIKRLEIVSIQFPVSKIWVDL